MKKKIINQEQLMITVLFLYWLPSITSTIVTTVAEVMIEHAAAG